MARRVILIEKDEKEFICHLNITTIESLWKNMNYPDNDIIQFITRYGNLLVKDQPSLPSLVEVIGMDMTDKVLRMDFVLAMRTLAIEENIGEEIYRGLVTEAIPISSIKVKFEMKMIVGGTESAQNATTVAGTTEVGTLDISNDDDFKSIGAIGDEPQLEAIREVPKKMIGFQTSVRVAGTGAINIGLKGKTKAVIRESYVEKAFPEQPYAKEINHDYIPAIDPFSRANKLDKVDISKKRLENLSSDSSVKEFIRELEAYIKSGVTEGIVVSTVADAKSKTMEFLAERFNLDEDETQNLTFDELRWLYAVKIARNMDEVSPTVAREEVLKALKEAGSGGRYASWNLAHMKTNNVDKAASFNSEIDLTMRSLFGEGEIDYYTMKLFTDGVKVEDKEGNEKRIQIIGSDNELDNIRANIKKYAKTWGDIKRILMVTAEEMDRDVQTRMDKGLLREQKEQISRMLKAEERKAQGKDKRTKDAKDGDKKTVNQATKPDGKRPPICDICGKEGHYGWDRELKTITCEKHKSTDLSKNEKLKKEIDDKLAKRIEARKKGRQHE